MTRMDPREKLRLTNDALVVLDKTIDDLRQFADDHRGSDGDFLPVSPDEQAKAFAGVVGRVAFGMEALRDLLLCTL